jgi:hypothetical protein
MSQASFERREQIGELLEIEKHLKTNDRASARMLLKLWAESQPISKNQWELVKILIDRGKIRSHKK